MEIPDEFRQLLFYADFCSTLTSSLGNAFPRDRLRRLPLVLDIAWLIFDEGLVKVKPVPRNATNPEAWGRVFHRARIVANYSLIAEQTGISEGLLRKWCPRIVEATIVALDKQFSSFVRKFWEDAVNDWYMRVTGIHDDICRRVKLMGMKKFFLFQLIVLNFIRRG